MARKRSAEVTLSRYRSAARPEMKWIVYWPASSPGKPRRYRRFKLKTEAETFQEQKQIDVQNKGAEAAAVHDEALEELKWAVKVLKPLGVSIREAIQSFVDRQAEIAASVPVSEAIRQFRDSKERDGASERYARDLRLRLAKFEESFGKKAVCDITVRELDRWLVGLGVGPTSRNNYRRNLGVFFSWCEGMGYCQTNPMRKTSRAKKKPEPVEIFSADQLRVILENAPGELLPALAIGGLAGIRVAEISRLDWSEINFDKGQIEVAAENSKTASRRFVPMEPALQAWLKKVARVSGPVTLNRLDERLSEYRKLLRTEQKDKNGVVLRPAVEWKDNGLRHSYGSYAIAREESADRVALWMGHTSAAVTFAHYQERATKEEAEAWFGVYPKGEESKRGKGCRRTG